MITLHDRVPISGHFHVEIFRRGKLIDIIDERNLIVDGAKNQLARLIGGDGANRQITRIGFGVGQTAAQPGDSALTLPPGIGQSAIKGIGRVSYPAPGQVQFDWGLSTSELNGVAITEFGLFCADGTLFSRKHRAPIQKESDLSLSGSWTIIF
ncbi:MAG: phage tail protein [Zoogloeaceae bacterium]|jgi:hypothetical protein|nr:phage tail protein [Zoogloeaceae bacterium]